MATIDPEGIVHDLLLAPEGRRNPYPHYHRLRRVAPVYRSATLEAWLLTRYEDCFAAVRDPRLGKDYARQMERRHGPDWRRHPSRGGREHSMLNLHGPEHARLRRLVAKSFTRRTIEELRPKIARMVRELLEPFVESGGGDVIDAIGFPLPLKVIGELLGVPEADRAQFRGLVRDVTAVLEALPSPDQLAAADAAYLTMRAYFVELIAEKRRHPADDLLSALVHERDEDRLTDGELVSLASLLFNAGFETTTNLIGNGLYGLLRHPDQLHLLREDGSLFEHLPEELLRYDGTAQLTVRSTLAPVEIGGVAIPAGEAVLALLGAANHDPARYTDPDRLDLRRTEIEPLSFGGGVHYCLGAALARAEIDLVFRALLDDFASIELAEEPRFRDRLTLRGLESLRVSGRPADRARASAAPRFVHAGADSGRPLAGPQPAAKPGDRSCPSRPSRTSPSPTGSGLGARPHPSSGDEDAAAWLDALRDMTERNDTGLPHRTGGDLAATVALLARASLFNQCTAAELERLAATAYPMSFEPGERLCVEGGEALECYVIAEGEAVVTAGERVLAEVGENRVVGERGPLEGRTRTATVTARSRLVTWAISRERLLDLVAANPAAAQAMHEEIRRRYPD